MSSSPRNNADRGDKRGREELGDLDAQTRARLDAIKRKIRSEPHYVHPYESPNVYFAVFDTLVDRHRPSTEYEQMLVRQLGDLTWQLDRERRNQQALIAWSLKESVNAYPQDLRDRLAQSLKETFAHPRSRRRPKTPHDALRDKLEVIQTMRPVCVALIEFWIELLERIGAGKPWTLMQEYHAVRVSAELTRLEIKEPELLDVAVANRRILYGNRTVTPQDFAVGEVQLYDPKSVISACKRQPTDEQTAYSILFAFAKRSAERHTSLLDEFSMSRLFKPATSIHEFDALTMAIFEESKQIQRRIRESEQFIKSTIKAIDNMRKLEALEAEMARDLRESSKPDSPDGTPGKPEKGKKVPSTRKNAPNEPNSKRPPHVRPISKSGKNAPNETILAELANQSKSSTSKPTDPHEDELEKVVQLLFGSDGDGSLDPSDPPAWDDLSLPGSF
jgi:hypothetical protein